MRFGQNLARFLPFFLIFSFCAFSRPYMLGFGCTKCQMTVLDQTDLGTLAVWQSDQNCGFYSASFYSRFDVFDPFFHVLVYISAVYGPILTFDMSGESSWRDALFHDIQTPKKLPSVRVPLLYSLRLKLLYEALLATRTPKARQGSFLKKTSLLFKEILDFTSGGREIPDEKNGKRNSGQTVRCSNMIVRHFFEALGKTFQAKKSVWKSADRFAGKCRKTVFSNV